MQKGFLKDRNFFSATKILAKHDENYMPPEVKAGTRRRNKLLYSVIGNYSLILGLFFGLILIYFSVRNFRNSKVLDTKILSFTFLQFFLVVISFLCLVLSFVVSDFSNETVFNNSHTTKPLFYKIAGTWGNHEGSLVTLVTCFNIIYFIFLLKTKNQPIKYKILTLVFQQIIIIGFFIFLIKTSNPFNHIYPIPEEGLGLIQYYKILL